MANVLFGHPNYADTLSSLYGTPTFSGGSWVAGLPLTNLQDPLLAAIARSTDATTANTQFDIDLKVARNVRVIALPRHTLSSAATLRVRASNVAGDFSSPTYDSTALQVWPSALSAEDAAGITIGYTLLVASTVTASRYWRFEIDDHTNAAGYVDLARLVMAGAYQPTVNFAWGATLHWATGADRVTSDGDAFLFADQPVQRVAALTLDTQAFDECLVQALELMRKLGTHGQLYFVFDPDDVASMYRRAFLARLVSLSPVAYANAGVLSAPFALEEVL